MGGGAVGAEERTAIIGGNYNTPMAIIVRLRQFTYRGYAILVLCEMFVAAVRILSANYELCILILF